LCFLHLQIHATGLEAHLTTRQRLLKWTPILGPGAKLEKGRSV
jgi:hypothetical protein